MYVRSFFSYWVPMHTYICFAHYIYRMIGARSRTVIVLHWFSITHTSSERKKEIVYKTAVFEQSFHSFILFYPYSNKLANISGCIKNNKFPENEPKQFLFSYEYVLLFSISKRLLVFLLFFCDHIKNVDDDLRSKRTESVR